MEQGIAFCGKISVDLITIQNLVFNKSLNYLLTVLKVYFETSIFLGDSHPIIYFHDACLDIYFSYLLKFLFILL